MAKQFSPITGKRGGIEGENLLNALWLNLREGNRRKRRANHQLWKEGGNEGPKLGCPSHAHEPPAEEKKVV